MSMRLGQIRLEKESQLIIRTKWVLPTSFHYQMLTQQLNFFLDLEELNELIIEAETKKFPLTAIYEAALKAKSRADKCAEVARKLASPAVRTRYVLLLQSLTNRI